MVELWGVKTLKLLSDVCNRARCAEILSVSSYYFWCMFFALTVID
jgi:hypothetical protein